MKRNYHQSLTKYLVVLFFFAFSAATLAQSGNSAKGGGEKLLGSSSATIDDIAPKSTVHFTSPITGNYNAGTFNGHLDGNTAKFYCIDVHTGLDWNATYTDDGHTSSPITYILNNYYPYRSYPYQGAASDLNTEAAAVQMAIWHFSDAATFSSGPMTRAQEIINAAISNAGNVSPVKTLEIVPVASSLPVGNPGEFVVEAYDENNSPVAGVEVHLSTTDGTLSATTVTTDQSGSSGTITIEQGSSSNATITASATSIIPQGTIYVKDGDPDGSQKLVLATPTIANVEDQEIFNWYESADLSIIKTVSDDHPEDGDEITFEITVTNDGPTDATGIEVTEALPAGMTDLNFSPSQGSYDSNPNVWTVGSLASGASAVLTVTATVDFSVFETTAFDLGIASDYNVFVLYDLDQPSSDTEGRMAVGRNAKLANYSVADKLPNSNGTDDVLIVGRKLTYTSGAVFSGNVVYGKFQDVDTPRVSIDYGTLRKDNVIDFGAARTELRNLSNQLKGYTTNGTTEYKWGGVYLTGTDPFLNVFLVSGDSLSDANNVDITVPNGSVVLVNIGGRHVTWHGGLEVHGTDISNVLYNFYKAKTLEIQGINVTGSILAPKASVNFVSGVQNGQMIAKKLTGRGQFNNVKFLGNLPFDEAVTNIVEITASDQPDPDSTPNNGDVDEDDYSDVTIFLSNVNTNNGGDNNGGTYDGNWEYVSGFGATEIVWTMATDADGYLLSGTLGGKIYRTLPDTVVVINPDMGVGFIWDIAVDPVNGKIWVATENGVYISRNNGATWELRGLENTDVRSIIAVGKGHVWAGTWGLGVYELSRATGYQFVQRNDGLLFTAVHSVAATSNGDLFAGTFGGGIYKSEDNGASWSQLDVGYAHIWALGVDGDDNIFAGTYGGGVYVSEDGGDSWQTANAGLNSMFIYAVTFDSNGDAFVTSWSNGVFKLDNGNSKRASAWDNMGLEALKVSSIYADQKTNTVFAGTSDGAILKLTDGVTEVVNENNTLPEEFDLSQNYPNPFNPATTIEFSIPADGKYRLAVYNIIGQEVAVIANGNFVPGKYSFNFDASNLSSGIYIYRLNGAKVNLTRKMILMK